MTAGGSSGAAWRGFAVAARNWKARTGAALQQSRSSEVSEGHAALLVAVGSLRTTAASLANRLHPTATTTPVRTRPVTAAVTGMLPALGALSTLRATRAVNENASTVRRSAQALGLDITSPTSPSTLAGLSGLGLNVTSPETPSWIESTASLGLDVTSAEAPSTLVSTAEANTAQTSYGVVQATFTNARGTVQSSKGNVSGVYAGTGLASNATSLRIRMDPVDVTIGDTSATVSFKVYDQNSTLLGSYTSLVTAGQSISLGADIGLSLSFSAGTILRNTETTFSVSRTTPTDVNPDATFNNADVNLRPRFENGAQVTAGSFTVNGTSVSVLAGDTIHTVLNRLNSTVTGVTALFSGDKVQLQTTSASEDNLVLANDTSGFLSALKLTGAATTRGNVRDDRQTLAKTAAFAAVQSGSFTVNGAVIAVNAATDSLQSVLARLNAAGAGVTASYDAATDRVRLTGTANSEDDIRLGGDSTGLLGALRLAGATTVRGNLHDDTQALAGVNRFAGLQAGSFRVNGVLITLDPAVDSLQAVLQRIQASGAGVTAGYDAATDGVVLATPGDSEQDIALTGDTTGFVAAAGLAGVSTERGRVRDDVQALGTLGVFAGVTAGSFRVNGKTIAVDPGVDTLATILARVNAAGAGVTAAYEAGSDELSFTPDAAGAPLALEDDTSGFLAAAGVAVGRVGTAVNPEAAFNGTGLAAPFFEEGRSVGAGSFRLNGVLIQVAADDTVNTVLDRITQSGAGVMAAYDAGTERVTLTAKAVGSTPIEVGEDTSGFLAAVKLDDTAVSVPGAGKLDGTLAAQPSLAGVVNGVITINGRTVAVTPGAQTLSGVAAALDGLEGVQFTLDEATGKVLLQAERVGDSLEIADTSGLLAALGIASGRVSGNGAAVRPAVWPSPPAHRPVLGSAEARGVAEDLAGALAGLNEAVDWIALASDAAVSYQNDVFAAVRGAMAGWSGRGLALEESAGFLQVGLDGVGLETALRTDAQALAEMLGGERGLVTALEAVLQAYGRNEEAMREPSAYTLAQARRAYGD